MARKAQPHLAPSCDGTILSPPSWHPYSLLAPVVLVCFVLRPRFEAKLEEENRQEQSQADRAVEELNRRREALVQERRKQLKEEMAKMGEVTADEKNAILERHNAELQKLGNALDAEKMRQRAALEEKLARKRDRKKKQMEAALKQKQRSSMVKRHSDQLVQVEAQNRAEREILLATEREVEEELQVGRCNHHGRQTRSA